MSPPCPPFNIDPSLRGSSSVHFTSYPFTSLPQIDLPSLKQKKSDNVCCRHIGRAYEAQHRIILLIWRPPITLLFRCVFCGRKNSQFIAIRSIPSFVSMTSSGVFIKIIQYASSSSSSGSTRTNISSSRPSRKQSTSCPIPTFSSRSILSISLN